MARVDQAQPDRPGWKAQVRTELRTFLAQARVSEEQAFATVFSEYDEILLHGQYACANDLAKKALRSFRECVRLRPDAFLPHCAIGRILMGHGLFARAEKHIRKAAELNPGDFKNRVTWLYLLNKTKSDPNRAMKLQQQINSNVVGFSKQFDYRGLLDTAVLQLDQSENFWRPAWRAQDRQLFRTAKFTLLHNVLPEGFRELLLLSQRAALRGGQMYTQSQWRRHGVNDLPLSAIANYQLAELVEKIIGRPVIPTYSFAIHYLPGGNMDTHRDRVQNELSLSLNLAVNPPADFPALRAGLDEDNLTEIHLAPNSALFYRGAEVFHARCAVPEGHRVDQVIFGFRTINSGHCYCI